MRCGSGLIVTDGTHTVSPATEIDFTSGATVTDLGGGIAGVAIASSTAFEVCSGVIANPNGAVQFAHDAGATLLSYTAPGRPKFVTAGNYSIFGTGTGLHIPSAGTWVQLGLVLNLAGFPAQESGGLWTNINYGGGQLYSGGFSAYTHFAANDSFEVDGSATDLLYNASVRLVVTKFS